MKKQYQEMQEDNQEHNKQLDVEFVTRLFDDKYTAQDVKELVNSLSKEEFYQMLTGPGFFLYAGPVVPKGREVAPVTLDLDKVNEPVRIGIYNITLTEEVMVQLITGEATKLKIDIKDDVVRHAVFTPINQLGGPTHKVTLIEPAHSYVPNSKLSEVLKCCAKFEITEIPILPEMWSHLKDNARYDSMISGKRPSNYEQQVNQAKLSNKAGLSIEILKQSINNDEFVQLFTHAPAKEFKNFVKAHKTELVEFVKTRNDGYLDEIAGLLPFNKVAVSLFEHLGMMGYQVKAGTGFLQPYTINNWLNHNIDQIPDLPKKLSSLLKELRGQEVVFEPEQVQYMKTWLTPSTVKILFDVKSKFTKAIKIFVESGYKLLAPSVEEAKNAWKESVIAEQILPKIKDMIVYRKLLFVDKTIADKKVVEFKQYLTEELQKVAQNPQNLLAKDKQVLDILEINPGNMKLNQENIEEISEQASKKLQKVAGAFVKASNDFSSFVNQAAFMKKLGSILKYKTTAYTNDNKLLSFFDYAEQLPFAKAMQTKMIKANKEFVDYKLQEGLIEHHWIELGGELQQIEQI
ncbi:hypothetical protein Trichorick_00260 [Candidatus Trichorickettsia mobilis]|uniref:Uncharacterized protein n=1 Tax=Candidatus Trichorickettsia mobilis TaxID=1346319 RepID=A0ABZ0UTH2_9RICK|nr:hypothetical protein [Candidatus Trichorickettsia mobilis]WPY00387.1 hypothetical protein Trichorick_00260 [Candidatus Trichorickettsia mobilis]